MEHKNTLEGDSDKEPVLPIIKDKAIEFITKFTNEYYKSNKAVQIPSAWLYERGIVESLAIADVVGIKFFSAINADIYKGLYGALTFIMVPVKLSPSGELVDMEDEVLYEFSQLCPDVCNIEAGGNTFPGFYIDKANPFVIPKSFYFPKSFFTKNFDTYPTSKGIRLYSVLDGNKLDLRIVPVEYVSPNYRDLPELQYSDAKGYCLNGSTIYCDTNSSLYIP